MRYFCTYFDSNYLTRGLAMYGSLKRHSGPFRLTILCLDDASLQRLKQLAFPECDLLSLSDLESADGDLVAKKGERSKVEYYFTLTPCFVRHLLPAVPEGEMLTYLDSDLYFYASPEPLFEELAAGSVGIISHRFPEHMEHMKLHGIFNVGWVSFRRDDEGQACADSWRKCCLEWCYDKVEDGRYADQAYLNDWPTNFPSTVVIQHLGANVAPWNVGQYVIAEDHSRITVQERELIFYHFHALKNVFGRLFDSQLSKYGVDVTMELRRYIYEPYLKEIYEVDRSLNLSNPDNGGNPTGVDSPRNGSFELIPRSGDSRSEAMTGQAEVEQYLYRSIVLIEQDRSAKQAVIDDVTKALEAQLGYSEAQSKQIRALRIWIDEINQPLLTKIIQYPPRLARSLRKKARNAATRCVTGFKKKWETMYRKQFAKLRQYEPRRMRMERFPAPSLPENVLPSIGIVTPSYMQGQFIERTIQSVLGQNYPRLHYVIQDGGSKDSSVEIIKRHESSLSRWASAPDEGQADAIKRGFQDCDGDILAWLNSDDMLMPGSLRFIGEYFASNPSVDVVYGHRVIIDENDQEVGRWVLPEHDNEILKWADYVPQETLFWRRRLWDEVGGVDTSFQFAIDWDLLLRFQEAGANIVRLPYFVGCFRAHSLQKTSCQMTNSTGDEEMARIRIRLHGRAISHSEVDPYVKSFCFRAAKTASLLSVGVRR